MEYFIDSFMEVFASRSENADCWDKTCCVDAMLGQQVMNGGPGSVWLVNWCVSRDVCTEEYVCSQVCESPNVDSVSDNIDDLQDFTLFNRVTFICHTIAFWCEALGHFSPDAIDCVCLGHEGVRIVLLFTVRVIWFHGFAVDVFGMFPPRKPCEHLAVNVV